MFYAQAIEAPSPVIVPESETKLTHDTGYLVVCWDDPINLMEYVTHVFQQVFGWDKAKAEKHMREVHNEGRSILARESFEKAEYYVHALQRYHLLATMEKDS